MRSIKASGLAVLLLLVSACSSTPSVNTDYNPDFNFAAATRFAVLPPARSSEGPLAGNDIMKQRAVDALEKAIRNRGFQIVAPSQADLLVSFFVTTKDKTDIRTYNTGYSYNRCYRAGCAFYGGAYPGGTDVDVRHYTEGTLFVDFIDPVTKQLQWRGVTSKKLTGDAKTTQQRQQVADDIANLILSEYPPGLNE